MVAHRATGPQAQANTAALPVTIPAGAQPGDLLVIPWALNNSVGFTTVPDGWDVGVQANGGACLLVVLRKVCDGDDAGSTITLTPSGTTRNAAQCVAYADAVWVDATTVGTGSNPAAAFPTPTNPVAGAACELSVVAGRTALTGSPAFTPPAGVVERVDVTTGAVAGSVIIGLGDALTEVTAGDIGGRSWTLNQNCNNAVGITIELAPTAAPPAAQTATVARATTTLTGRAVTPAAGPAARTVTRAAATMQGRAVTTVPGAASRTLARAALTATSRPVTAVGSAAARVLARALVVATGRTITATGDSTATVARALTTLTARGVAPVPGGAARSVARAAVPVTGRPIGVQASATRALDRATITLTGRPLTAVPGAATRAVGRAIVVATGRTLTTLSGSTATLARATTTLTARPVQAVPGPTARGVQRATLPARGRPLTPTPGQAERDLTTATLTVLARGVGRVAAATARVLERAAVTLTGRDVDGAAGPPPGAPGTFSTRQGPTSTLTPAQTPPGLFVAATNRETLTATSAQASTLTTGEGT